MNELALLTTRTFQPHVPAHCKHSGPQPCLNIKPVGMQVFVCRSGSAADTQNMSAYVRYFLHQHQMELEEPLVEVKTAARLAQQLIYQNKVGLRSKAGLLCHLLLSSPRHIQAGQAWET